jgi:hypothetical protein
MDARMRRVLPTRHFHCVFTAPAELRVLFRCNPVRLYDLLFEAASHTLLDLGRDPEHLGAQLAFTAVLHTWDRSLNLHPHVHAVVSGGGLTADGKQWIPNRRDDFLFPVAVVSALFRGKFLDGLCRLYREGQLHFGTCVELGAPRPFQRLVNQLYKTHWHTYLKDPFGGAEHVYRYLSRYISRIGISNHRIRSFDDRSVTFATKDGKHISLEPREFIRRFLQHVPPRGFVRVRHYGLLAPANVNTRLEAARRLLAEASAASTTPLPARATTPSTTATTAARSSTIGTPAPTFCFPSLSDEDLGCGRDLAVAVVSTNADVPVATATAPVALDGTSTPSEAVLVTIEPAPSVDSASPTGDQRLEPLTGRDPWLCPRCNKGRLMRYRVPPAPRPRRIFPEPRIPDTS